MIASNSAAVIAGAGMLPVYWAGEASARGLDLAVISISDAVEEEPLKRLAYDYFKTSAGRLGEIIDYIRSSGIDRAVFLGKVGWEELFGGRGPDHRLKEMLGALENSRNVNAFLKLLAEEFHREGIKLLEQTVFMEAFLAGDGLLTPGIAISDRVLKDMEFAFSMAKKISGLGIGQTVVVKDGAVIAVEAVEGTDQMIKRSGGLVAGGIVAKARAANHDARFDIPAVGLHTVESMIKAGSAGLVLEAQGTFVFQRQEVTRLAQRHNIPIMGMRWTDA